MTHHRALPPEIVAKMGQPEGILTFTYTSEELFEPGVAGTLLEQVAGAHVFRLSRDADLHLTFHYASPGTGTRAASLSIGRLRGSKGVVVFLVWSPDEIRLRVGDVERRAVLREARGVPSPLQLHAQPDGSVIEIGGPGLSVSGVRIRSGGKLLHKPTAREAWDDTALAMRTLLTGTSSEGYLFETVQANAVIVMLVTGFEAYCETRFVEVEREGTPADFQALAKRFSGLVARHGDVEAFTAKAAADGTTPISMLADRINFQNYEAVRDAYRYGYGIRFADLAGVTSETIRSLKQTISFRHRIIHVSPLLSVLNEARIPDEPPLFANRPHAEGLIGFFEGAITALHQATLELRPSN
jgi:hypothetical protein